MSQSHTLIILLPDSLVSFLQHRTAGDWSSSALLLLCDPAAISTAQLQQLRALRLPRYWLVNNPGLASDETLIDYEQWIELTLRFEHTFFWPTT
jgi:hypothetical protein